MKSTHFNNPHGLPSDGHQTTARDLAQLAFAAFQAAAFREARVDAAARLHARFGVRLSAQHRVEEHEPIVADRRVRRYKNRHDGRGGQLPGFDRRARRAAADHRRARLDVDRLALHRHAQSVSLGVEGLVEDWRRRREDRATASRKQTNGRHSNAIRRCAAVLAWRACCRFASSSCGRRCGQDAGRSQADRAHRPRPRAARAARS